MAVDLPTAVLAFIAALENVTGVPIAILERMDRTEDFWARSAAILCQKTKEPFCDEKHLRFMTSNTEPMGQSQIIEYDFDNTGPKRVCAIIPPIPDINPAFVSEAYGRGHPGVSNMPSPEEAAAWLMLYHASHCLDTEMSKAEEDRADALATLGLAILEGAPEFTHGNVRSPARKMAVMTGSHAAYWAAGTGERILIDLWKQEVADRLRQQNCYAIVQVNASIDIENIRRDHTLEAGNPCASADETPGRPGRAGSSYTAPQVTVTDANLWIWMYGQGEVPALGAPPQTYTPAKTFPDMETAASYVLQTANSLSR